MKNRTRIAIMMVLLIGLIMITSCTTMIGPIRITFLMGNTRNDVEGSGIEKPVHEVIFTYQFILGNNEVTFDEYDAYCNAIGIIPPFDMLWGRGTRPVINVSWFDAIKYCNWRSEQEGYQPAYNETTGGLLDKNGNSTTDLAQVEGYRLPTEAEWEYEARGGILGSVSRAETNDYKYAGSDDLNTVGWYSDNSDSKTHPVGAFFIIDGKHANESGKYDMSGNVAEWCYDWFGLYSGAAQTNPTGPPIGVSYRVVRGGDSGSDAVECRVASRGSCDQNDSYPGLGFRLARTVY